LSSERLIRIQKDSSSNKSTDFLNAELRNKIGLGLLKQTETEGIN
jgi:hypothetical protein